MNSTNGSIDPFSDDNSDPWATQKAERERYIPQGLSLHDVINDSITEEPITQSPDGRYITAGATDGSVRLWDRKTREEVGFLPAHSKHVSCVAWSSSGLLASGARDSMICLWKPEVDIPLHMLMGHIRSISALAWSPSENLLASGAEDKSVCIWDIQTGTQSHILQGHAQIVRSVVWSQDEQVLASGDDSGQIRLWHTHEWKLLQVINAHMSGVCCMACSPTNASLLASGGNDATIRIWDMDTGRQIHILEGHTRQVTNVVFSPDGRLLVSQSTSNGAEVCFWSTATWELLASLPIDPFNSTPLAFQTNQPLLLTGGETRDEMLIWTVDIDLLLQSRKPTIQYSNVKVVLAGDSGVGKTGLFRVLCGEPFMPTESTHARNVSVLNREEVPVHDESVHDDRGQLRERREILLWDLAGQPGYRVIHQLRLREVALGLIVFDGRDEIEPFTGVYFWDRALRQAHSLSRQAVLPLKKLLVAARIDRGGIPVSKNRINSLIQELGFEQYMQTSAKDGHNIEELREAIKNAIVWDAVPHITSNELFDAIKAFLLNVKLSGLTLIRTPDLYNSLITSSAIEPDSKELRAQFERCIELVESRDLIMRFRFARYILLQPERLDAYSAALVNSVLDEPEGMGSILESWAKKCLFRMSRDARVPEIEDEKLLLLAMIQDVLLHELALLEHTPHGNYLIFPSQATRENHELANAEGKLLRFEFEGSIQHIYATLAVRLSRSELFKKKDLWKDAIRFTTSSGNLCGLYLERKSAGHGYLTLFFDAQMVDEARFHFEDYVEQHLRRWAIPNSVHRIRLFTCTEPSCRESVSPSIVPKRRKRGHNWLDCSNCGTRIDITDDEKPLSGVPSQILEMDAAADRWRNLDVLRSIRREEVDIDRKLGDKMSYYDIFLCYSASDRLAVRQIGDQFLALGMLPWFDEWEVQPGQKWDEILRAQISSIGAVAVFVGKNSPAPWQDTATDQLLRDFKEEQTIISVILPGGEQPSPSLVPDYIKAPWIDMPWLEPGPPSSLIERVRSLAVSEE